MDKIGLSVKKYSVLMQHYRSQYAVHYPVIAKSPFSASHAYCNVDLNIGLTDIIKHVGTVKHFTKAALHTNMRKVLEFFTWKY